MGKKGFLSSLGVKELKSTTSVENSPSPSPVAPNAPKFGTLVPNRIFVGGISANTTETELHALFSNYGNVKATKIISDRAGVSKGYGFVTFETEEEAKRIQKEGKNKPFTRVYDPTQSASNGTIFYHNGMPYTYQNGMAFFTTPENLCQLSPPQQTAYSVIYPHPVYVPQQQFQYQTATPTHWTSGQWRWSPSSTGLPTQYVYSALPTAASGSNATEICQYGGPIPNCSSPVNAQMASPYTQTNPSTEYADSSTADSPSSEVNKGYSKKTTNNCGNSRKHPSLRKNSTTLGTSGAGDGPPSHYQKCPQQSQLIAKTVNGITVMAYPTPFFINTSQRAADHSAGDRDTFALVSMTDIGMIQQLSTNPVNPLPSTLIPADGNGGQSKF
ncbi:protein boule-like [Centruroides sculpturatus]|uniref:protein boule-like n=1 Tax=Centruroides sculpturatus TaxID=218467 RepID=UPI000C6E29DC|nr:protein boule-like [Centruroides sculpturatus]